MILDRIQLKNIFGVDYYNGEQIHTRFAFRVYRDKVIPTGNIIAFVSPTIVESEHMIDLQDLLDKDFIYSDSMVNFCWELPLTNLYGGVCFQRLYCSMLGDMLAGIIKKNISVCGDDIFVEEEFKKNGIIIPRGKASVSIACERNGAILGHTGINIVAGEKAPDFAYSTNMNTNQTLDFMNKAIDAFYQTTQSIFIATSKIIS